MSYQPRTGDTLKSDGTTINVADMIEDAKATGAVAVTPSDSSFPVTSGIYLGTSGDLSVVMKNGTEITFKSLAAGVIHPLSVTKVKTTNTTASNIIAVY